VPSSWSLYKLFTEFELYSSNYCLVIGSPSPSSSLVNSSSSSISSKFKFYLGASISLSDLELYASGIALLSVSRVSGAGGAGGAFLVTLPIFPLSASFYFTSASCFAYFSSFALHSATYACKYSTSISPLLLFG